MTMVDTARRTLHCPVPRCGMRLCDVAGDGAVTLWRGCPKCGAVVRFELPAGRWTVEREPSRPPG